MSIFRISSFEYLPNIGREDAIFFTSLRKFESPKENNGFYLLDVPNELRNYLLTYAKVTGSMVVFLPDLAGFNDLDIKPRFCPGGLAVQMRESGHLSRLDFANIVRCLAEPWDGQALA